MDKKHLTDLVHTMFSERKLSKEEQESEIKKFREGVAPLYPSFIINQEKLVEELQNALRELFLYSRAMELFIFVGNPGEGKSHILNIMYNHLKKAPNNVLINERTKGFSDKLDLVVLILNRISSPVTNNALKEAIRKALHSSSTDAYTQQSVLMENFKISLPLAKVLWKFCYAQDEHEKIRALNVLLARDQTKETLRKLNITEYDFAKDSLNFFYILMEILKNKGIFIFLFIEELEHIFKSAAKQRSTFYEQLKEFIDNSERLGNLCIFMFSTYVFNETFNGISYTENVMMEDRALYTRLEPKKRILKRISSKAEMTQLVQKIFERYNKVYPLSNFYLISAVDEIETTMHGDKSYRGFIQNITAYLDRKRANIDEPIKESANLKSESDYASPKSNVEIVKKIAKTDLDNPEVEKNDSKDSGDTIGSALQLKKKIILSINKLLELNFYKDIKMEIKKSYLVALPKNKKNNRLFFLDFTGSNKVKEKYSNLTSLNSLAESLNCDRNKIYYIYLKDKVTNSTEGKLLEYNPNFKMISLKEEDIITLLTLVEETDSESDKILTAKQLAGTFQLEIG